MKHLLKKAVSLLATGLMMMVCVHNSAAQSGTVTGTVTDEAGIPMIGLTVVVTGTTT